ncbi:MAG TPA: arsenate reductase ArsC [Bacteroidota bacterium]|nr:arsenate reductase ArsC [Bacteroidota bacterium]
MEKTKVLFVCVQNSARSQMAEALLNRMDGDRFQAESAGIEPGKLNPLAIAAMKQMDIDISHKDTRDVFDLWRKGGIYNYVITVCDEASGERCPIFPGVTKRLHWSFDDPATFTGAFEERLARTISVRDQIKERIQAWIHELNP